MALVTHYHFTGWRFASTETQNKNDYTCWFINNLHIWFHLHSAFDLSPYAHQKMNSYDDSILILANIKVALLLQGLSQEQPQTQCFFSQAKWYVNSHRTEHTVAAAFVIWLHWFIEWMKTTSLMMTQQSSHVSFINTGVQPSMYNKFGFTVPTLSNKGESIHTVATCMYTVQ